MVDFYQECLTLWPNILKLVTLPITNNGTLDGHLFLLGLPYNSNFDNIGTYKLTDNGTVEGCQVYQEYSIIKTLIILELIN